MFLALSLPARAQILQSMGFDVPFLAGAESDVPLPIDIGGDRVTDLLCAGSAILQGSQVLEGFDSEAGTTVHLLRPDPIAGWRCAQTFVIEGTIQEWTAADLDGDGLDDLLIVCWSDPTQFVLAYLQDDRGLLARNGRSDFHFPASSIEIDVGSDGGIVISSLDLSVPVTSCSLETGVSSSGSRVMSGSGPIAYGLHLLSLRCDRGMGLKLVGSDWIGLEGPPFINNRVILHDKDRHVILLWPLDQETGTPEYTLWGTSEDSSGWRGPSPLVDLDVSPNDLCILRRPERSEAWWYSNLRPDTLFQLVPVHGVDSLTIRAHPVENMPDYWSRNDGLIAHDAGDSVQFILSRYSNDETILVSAPEEGRPVFRKRWTGTQGDIVAVVQDPDRRLSLLWEFGYEDYIILPMEELEPRRLDYYVDYIRSVSFQGDFDFDGLADVIFEGRVGDWPPAFWMLRGVDHPPWFGDPEPLAGNEDGHLELLCLADLDGDGFKDILASYRGDARRDAMVPFFWDGWRFVGATESAVASPGAPEHIAVDLDGNGREEILCRRYSRIQLLRWGPDRRPQTSPSVQAGIFGSTPLVAGDFDGNGTIELLRMAPWMLDVWTIDQDTGVLKRISEFPTRIDPRWIFALDLDGDGADEIFWIDDETYGIFSLRAGMTVLQPRACGPLPGFASDYLSLRKGDIDLDGRVDLILNRANRGAFCLLLNPLGDATVQTTAIRESLTGSTFRTAAWLDVDRDGDLDCATFLANGIRVDLNSTIAPATDRKIDHEWLRLVSPNPTRGPIRLCIHGSGGRGPADPISVGLYDVSGRNIWRALRTVPSGDWLDMVIDPRSGDPGASAGVYFLRVQRRQDAVSRRIVLVP